MPSSPRLSSEFHVLGVSGQSFKGIKRRYPNEIAKLLQRLVAKVIHEHGSIIFYHELLQRLFVLIASRTNNVKAPKKSGTTSERSLAQLILRDSRSSIFGSFTLGENYAPLVSILRYNCRVCNSGEDHRTARSASNARGRELWQPPKGQGSKRRNTVERGINVGRTVRKVERRARASREPGVWLRLSSGTRQGSEARNVRRPACSKIDDSKSGELNRATTEEAEHGGSRRSFPVVGDITPQRLGRKGNVAPVPPNQHQFRERLSGLVETAPNTLSQEVRKIKAVGLCFAGRNYLVVKRAGPLVERSLPVAPDSGSTVHLRQSSAKQ
ncbi:hypothetical protein B0H14DRAFT_2634042 [Mycena olivaceomarginata]|nr:hypothetical protein B0H14DRAFT_2634042 [Mycena olivaceomarginata]